METKSGTLSTWSMCLRMASTPCGIWALTDHDGSRWLAPPSTSSDIAQFQSVSRPMESASDLLRRIFRGLKKTNRTPAPIASSMSAWTLLLSGILDATSPRNTCCWMSPQTASERGALAPARGTTRLEAPKVSKIAPASTEAGNEPANSSVPPPPPPAGQPPGPAPEGLRAAFCCWRTSKRGSLMGAARSASNGPAVAGRGVYANATTSMSSRVHCVAMSRMAFLSSGDSGEMDPPSQ
mmetsp:Transcript_34115/g.77043  ORF Transcript_34115/g.77043 Transcript_34115/m.77043 type:complete len:238 (-) Transcript_34115:123-836(-)